MRKRNKHDLDHAEHNYKACHFLQLEGKGQFNDWVISTAFYSALYFVYYRLFPNKYKIKSSEYPCESFGEYCNYSGRFRENKHLITEHLVNEHIPQIAIEFKTLMDLCFTARYKKYQITQEEVDLAMEQFKVIRTVCLEDDSPKEQKDKEPSKGGKPTKTPLFSTSQPPPFSQSGSVSEE